MPKPPITVTYPKREHQSDYEISLLNYLSHFHEIKIKKAVMFQLIIHSYSHILCECRLLLQNTELIKSKFCLIVQSLQRYGY